jgi:serine/threonine-protein kinase RsbW
MIEERSQSRVFPARFASLSRIAEFVKKAAQAAQIDARGVYAVQMAVDEAVSNIINHAYGGESDETIRCTYHVHAKGLTVQLRDHGERFDPDEVPAPNLCPVLEERDAGGLGFYFICSFMDEVNFDFSETEGNVLTLIKYR